MIHSLQGSAVCLVPILLGEKLTCEAESHEIARLCPCSSSKGVNNDGTDNGGGDNDNRMDDGDGNGDDDMGGH